MDACSSLAIRRVRGEESRCARTSQLRMFTGSRWFDGKADAPGFSEEDMQVIDHQVERGDDDQRNRRSEQDPEPEREGHGNQEACLP